MAAPVFATNDVPSASQVNDWMVNVNWVRSTLNEDRTSTTTKSGHPALIVPVVANAVYRFECNLQYEAVTTAGIALGWTYPSGTTMRFVAVGPSTGGTGSYTDDQTAGFSENDSVAFGAQGIGVVSGIYLVGTVITTTNGGNLQMTFAQRVSNATRTRVFAQAWLNLDRKE